MCLKKKCTSKDWICCSCKLGCYLWYTYFLYLASNRLVLDQQRPLPDRRSYMLTVRHALTRKLTRSKTMQWWPQANKLFTGYSYSYSGTFDKHTAVFFLNSRLILWYQHCSVATKRHYFQRICNIRIWMFSSLCLQLLPVWISGNFWCIYFVSIIKRRCSVMCIYVDLLYIHMRLS